MRKQIQVGSTVVVRLYDGREVVAKITAIVNGPAGQKVHVAFGALALKIDPGADRQNRAGIAITNRSLLAAKMQIVYGSVKASINPAQITEVLPTS